MKLVDRIDRGLPADNADDKDSLSNDVEDEKLLGEE